MHPPSLPTRKPAPASASTPSGGAVVTQQPLTQAPAAHDGRPPPLAAAIRHAQPPAVQPTASPTSTSSQPPPPSPITFRDPVAMQQETTRLISKANSQVMSALLSVQGYVNGQSSVDYEEARCTQVQSTFCLCFERRLMTHAHAQGVLTAHRHSPHPTSPSLLPVSCCAQKHVKLVLAQWFKLLAQQQASDRANQQCGGG